MTSAISTNFRWLVSIGGKLWRVAPAQTLMVVACTFTSQVSLLFAFFLPLKVAILLGSDTVPSYYPDFLAELGKDFLIIAVTTTALASYLVHIASNRIVDLFIRNGVRRLIDRSQKLVLYANQDDIATQGYQRFSRILAGGVFVIVSWIALHFLFIEMAYVLTTYIFLATLIVLTIREFSASFRAKLENDLFAVLSILDGVGFMCHFGFLIVAFLWLEPPSVIGMLISLLLVRQSLGKLCSIIGDLKGLSDSRVQLSSLFFHGQVVDGVVSTSDSVWSLLKDRGGNWLPDLLADVREISGIEQASLEDRVDFRWIQTGVPNILNLEILAASRPILLIRLFEVHASTLAQHEAALLVHSPRFLPALNLIHVTQIEKYHCHVLELCASIPVETPNFQALARQLRSELLRVEPPPNLVQQYQRSRPMLWQKIDSATVERLRDVSGNLDERIDRLEESLDLLTGILRALPLCFVNPDASVDTLKISAEGDAWLLHWGRWALEPLGAGWPPNAAELTHLSEARALACDSRPELKPVCESEAGLAAIAYAFEMQVARQRYASAIEMLPELLARLDDCVTREKLLSGAVT